MGPEGHLDPMAPPAVPMPVRLDLDVRDIGQRVRHGPHSGPFDQAPTGGIVSVHDRERCEFGPEEHGLGLEGNPQGAGHQLQLQSVLRNWPRLTELTIEIESDDDTSAARLAAKLTEAFTLRIPVTRVATGTLPRFELKARRWVRG